MDDMFEYLSANETSLTNFVSSYDLKTEILESWFDKIIEE